MVPRYVLIDTMSSNALPTRERILGATWSLLEGGGSKVRMADIAAAAKISRQALYLHFPTRAELLIAATRHVDEVKDVDARLAASRSAPTGRARLAAFIAAWGGYIPEIHGVGRALMAMQGTDAEAASAWSDRMRAVRHGCAAAVDALQRDGDLAPSFTPETATDFLSMLVSVPNWEHLVLDCGWPQERYVASITRTAEDALIAV
jgi:AcrR family transcriptional regulator